MNIDSTIYLNAAVGDLTHCSMSCFFSICPLQIPIRMDFRHATELNISRRLALKNDRYRTCPLKIIALLHREDFKTPPLIADEECYEYSCPWQTDCSSPQAGHHQWLSLELIEHGKTEATTIKTNPNNIDPPTKLSINKVVKGMW